MFPLGKFSELAEANPRIIIPKGDKVLHVAMELIRPGRSRVRSHSVKAYSGGGAKFQTGDTLFGRIAPCLQNGKIAQYRANTPDSAFGSTEFFVLRARQGISDPDFLLYLSLTSWVRGPAEKSMSGASGRQRADLSAVLNAQVPLPSLPTQICIASILSAYDDLIDNNTRRIEALEEMARRLYEEWFVYFRFPGHETAKKVESDLGKIPEGWAVRGLYDVAELTYGHPFKSNQFNEIGEGTGLIRIRDIKPDAIKTFTLEEGKPEQRVLTGDILIGMDGLFHMSKWSAGDAWLNQRVVRLRPKEGISSYFLFLLVEGPIKRLERAIVGTTVAHLSARDLKEMVLTIPDGNTLALATDALEPLYQSELTLKRKNANLRAQRDLLLPKLISGEIDVSEAEGLAVEAAE